MPILTEKAGKIISKVYIGFGSNVGNRHNNIIKSYQLIEQHGRMEIIRKTDFKETAPWGVTNQSPFINSIAEMKTSLSPYRLLDELKIIEKKVGRKETTQRWGPREIDLDILLYDKLILNTLNLTIPHNELVNRKFIIEQLIELDPNIMHPLHQKELAIY